jgi:hypothetical protein
MSRPITGINRRRFIAGSAVALGAFAATPTLAQVAPEEPDVPVQRNTSGFRAHHWQPYFNNLTNGVILVDTKARTLHYWSEDETVFLVYPTSVPLSEDLTRRGRTEFIGPGPDNPLGTHALYLSWQYYRIHGTHDTRKIGRQSSNGCVGLYNEDIQELFQYAKVGTQVLLI